MGPLKVLAAAVVLATGTSGFPASASGTDPWRPLIAEASARFGVPEDWIVRVMRAESGGRTHLMGAPITSHAGAMGLMQVMPRTYAAMAAVHGLGPDPHDPRDNILAGTAYLRAMYDRYGYPGLFAAYNAGPGRYEQHLARGRALPRETRSYVAALTAGAPPARLTAKQPRKMPAETLEAPPRRSLFFALSKAANETSDAAAAAPGAGLFVPLKASSGSQN